MYSKYFSLLLFTLILFSPKIFAQNQSLGTVFGEIVSESNKNPLEFVSVSLIHQPDSTVVSGDVTDSKGKFEIKNIPFGQYFLRYSFIGFNTLNSAGFKLDARQTTVKLGTINLSESYVALKEVSVTSNKLIMTNAIDRKVYNVQQDIMSTTGSASDLLQNIPSVQVDIDGNVSLRGSTNVMILINGKTSPLMGKTRADALQQIPASSIEKIEVVTNPSAKYKPDGTSGIINIVMKKETKAGLNGSVSGNVGNKNRYNANTNVNYNPGSFNIFGSLSIRQDNRNQYSKDTRTQYDTVTNTIIPVPNYYEASSQSNGHPLSYGISLGVDYNYDSQNSSGISGNYFYRRFIRNETSTKVLKDYNYAITEDYDRLRYNKEYEIETEATAYFEHDFSAEDHKLRLEFTASRSSEEENNRYTNIYRVPTNTNQYDNTIIKQGDDKNHLSLAYENPLAKNSTLEAGYEGDFNKTDLDYFGEYFDNGQGAFVKDLVKTNHFIYNENIHALYLTYSNEIGALSFLSGLRAEQSKLKANLVSRDSIISNDYYNVYPTLHLSYKLTDASELQLNYSRRANRPEGDELNPFPEYQDPRNIRAGNPRLKPEFIHSVEFGYQWQNDFVTIVPAIFYRNKYNGFTSVTQAMNDSTLLTTQTNLSTEKSAGFEIVAASSSENIFSANLSTNAFYEEIDASNLGFSKKKSTVTWSGNMSCNVNLFPTTTVQINSNYRSARLTPQGEYQPSFVVNLGLRQDIFGDRLSAVLTISDIFKTQKREMNFDASWLKQHSINQRDSRVIYFDLTYHLSQPTKKSKDKSMEYDN
ncbi:MAG: TonB-dependent receptor [Ignavibacteria bacterium]|nr:TonB-dependent receptor [Ignavibacteria bacterium]